ncbi:MAG TPA: glycosyltransferase family 2 protein [Caulobacterales bacterium]|nr:glycosyltransferase family 2 protein [Caulobacterales bacterium]
MTSPFLIVIPCLNEEAHLDALLSRLRADPAAGAARIVVADGGSTDRSVEIVRAHAEADARIVSMHNPKRIQSAGVNMAVAHHAVGEFFVRLDAHAHYPDDFLARLINAYETTGADSVTVSMHATSQGGCFQSAAAAAQNSALGNGGSSHRNAGARRWVEHGHHALFRTASFEAAGGYDESFTHNEDAELDTRITGRGGRILLAGDIVMDYFPRARAWALARQYFNYGKGRARTALKHASALKPRQLAPVAVAPAAILALLTPMSPWAGAPLAFWFALCLGFGFALGLRTRTACAFASGVPAAIMHAAWSFGFWRQLLFSADRASTHARSQWTSAPETPWTDPAPGPSLRRPQD